MSTKHDLGYSVFKIFVVLFVLTALEVFWGMYFRPEAGYSRWLLWGGLLIFALAKGMLIFMYFMHMRFERWIVWSLIVPTPALILVILFALLPDMVMNRDVRDHPLGHMLNAEGEVVDVFATSPTHGGEPAPEH